MEGKRTKERTVSFQTLLNCLDGLGTRDGVLVVATANDPTCLDAAILKRPGRKQMALLAEIDLLLAAEHDPKPSATISPNGRARLSRPHVKQ